MSETYKKITKDGSKVQVESAIRDGEGVKISTNYAKKSEIPTPITVDSEMSTTSTNPVRNSTITNAFYNRMAIAFDTSTTQRYLAIKSGSTSLNQYRDFLVVYSTGDVILLTIQGDNWHAYFIEKKTDLVNKIYQYRQNIAEQYEFLLGIDFTNITETRVNVSIISVSRDAFNGTPSYRTIIGEPTTSTTFSVLTEITPSIPATISDIPTNVSAFTNDAGYLTQHQDISGKENTSNKVTSISSSSTDTEYPSAKCVYSNTVSDITYDSTNKKLKKTKGGTTSDVVTFGANAFTNTTIPTTYVSTVNGSSGAITNVAVTNVNNNFSTDQTITGAVTATYFNATSDKRLKKNIKPYKAKASILDLPIKQFDYKITGHHSIGCLAQDLQKICPEIVNVREDGYLTIEESKIVYLLLQEVKELKEEVKKLKGE